MAIRLFTCASCGHKMRLRGASCGKCFAPKTLFQHPEVWVIPVALIIALAMGIVLSPGFTPQVTQSF